MIVIVDRFEENFAVCEKENRTMINIEISKLPTGTKVGDSLYINCGKIIINEADTQKRKKEIEDEFKDIWD
ncbi:DUF3006 domain-containing protein [Clostridium hydrogenum]|uniref:DUF3006 domain-containing protein n=1 Tax=Clostridium hydrogenum TaxID=2855764 RepID=UPI001F301D40|nr:DUF3006 domain-containing protein [Clostridium hydrogenum]